MQQAEPLTFEFPHPPFVDLVERHGVDEMQLFPATPDRAHQIGRLQYLEVLRGGLPGHVQVFAKLAERLPVLFTKKVKQLSARWIAQRLENLVGVHRSHSYVRRNMQVNTCMSSPVQINESGGGDWVLVRQDGVADLDIRMLLRTDDGALIYLRCAGTLDMTAEHGARIMRGETVDSSEYYFRTSVLFETAAEQYFWLNRRIAIGFGERTITGMVTEAFVVT